MRFNWAQVTFFNTEHNLFRIIQFWRMNMQKVVIATLAGVILSLSACQPLPVDPLKVEVLELGTKQQQQSYAMGASVGKIIQDKITAQQELGIEFDKTILLQGFVSALQGQSQLDENEIQSLSRALEDQVREQKLLRKTKLSEENLVIGAEFLATNGKRAGIFITNSGLQYEVLKPGEGAKPKVSDTVTVNYLGTLLNGTEFDSSYARNKPTSFPLNRVIKGWTEGLQLMNVGSKFKFYIPANLAYGARSTGKISGHSTLIFEVELIEILDTK
jgi:FKBP-type peptidyl-prolyl cis-trans isomerase FkpA